MARQKLTGKNKQLVEDWEEFLRQVRTLTAVDFTMSDAEKSRKLKELEADPIAWMKFFFYKFAKYEFAGFQKKAIRRIINHSEGNWYEVLSWARELAKSTIVMMTVLYLVIVKKNKRVIILASATSDAAIKLLNVYRAQFEANERLRYFYGDMRGTKWTEDYFVLSNRASFMAMGWGQSPRGVKLDEVRPDLLLMDDYDTDEECRNIEVLNNKWRWFENALFFTRSISEALLTIWTGNIIAKDCCVVRAGNKARELADREKPLGHWDIINLRMVDINHPDPQEDYRSGKSVWPEKNSEEAVDEVLAQVSLAAGQKECFNNPVIEGHYFDEIKWGECPPVHKLKYIVSYGDPAYSNKVSKKAAQNSFKANILCGLYEGTLYVYTCFLQHVTNDEFVNWYYYLQDYVNERAQLRCFIENNTLQDPFYEQVFKPIFLNKGKERGFYINISPDARKKPEKFARIEGNLEPLHRAGRLVLNIKEKDNPHMLRLQEQFNLFDDGLPSPADGPDAVEGGYYMCQQLSAKIETGSIWYGKRHTNKKDSKIMAYLTTEDMYTHIYQENIETISHGDEAIMLSAIDAAIEEASGYLTKYDTQAIFSATGSARNAILLLFVKDIAAWHFVNLCNAGVDLELREKRYNRAIEWLENNQNRNNPNLPAKPDSTDCGHSPGCSCQMDYGSNRKRDNHF